MKIIVFGATGGTGRHIVDQALDAGHIVTAFARYPNRIHRTHRRLRLASGQAQDRKAVLEAIEDQDAVVSALGQVQARPSVAHIMTVAATNIIEAMTFHGVRRLVFLLGAAVRDPNDEASLSSRLTTALMRLTGGHVHQDAEDAAELIRLSALDWTIVRAPRLSDDPPRGGLQAGYRNSGFATISRADVAAFMLAQIESERYLRQAPMIQYQRTEPR